MPVNFRYRKIGYVALNVTDVARTTEFATRTYVLENTGVGPLGEQFLSCGQEHHDVVIASQRTYNTTFDELTQKLKAGEITQEQFDQMVAALA